MPTNLQMQPLVAAAMSKASVMAIAMLLIETVSGFALCSPSLLQSSSKSCSPSPSFSSSTVVSLSSSQAASEDKDDTDDYDDWYADFDPSDYEDLVNDSNNDNGYNGGTFNSRGGSRSSRQGGSRGNGRSGSGDNSHDYTRDYDADDSRIDEIAVNGLIADRLEAKKSRRYDEADAIRDQLLHEHGVAIFDRERIYRTRCSGSSGSGMKWRPPNNTRDNNGRRQQSNQGRRKQVDFGPNGHDYNLATSAGPNTSSLTDDEIHELLAERLRFKLGRKFADADAIQDELMQAGVFVNDGSKEWRADGQGFVEQRGGSRRNDRNRPYTQSPHSTLGVGADTDLEQTIQDLVDERVEAKRVRDFDVADDIREELNKDFNVRVDDRLRMWSVGGDFGFGAGAAPGRSQSSRAYIMSPTSTLPENANDIQALVQERDEARKARDFETADDIRDELLGQNVMIDDKLRQWAVGGRFDYDTDVRNDRGTARASPTDYNAPFVKRGAGGDMTADDEARVVELLQERSEAKRDRAFGQADRIRDRLQAEFKVRIDDRAREWHVVSDKYAMHPTVMASDQLDEEARVLIEERIVERAVAKLERDYETADAIRDELAEVYGVDIDDRVREWRIVGAPLMTENDDDDDYDDEVFVAPADDSELQVEEPDFELAFENANDKESIIDATNGKEEIGERESSDEEYADETVTVGEEELQALTIPELKVRLKDAGLPVSGRKAELIERLTASS